MTVISSQSINPEFIKLRWQEPYVSAGLNRKGFKTIPRGIYRGFDIIAGPGSKEISVISQTVGSVSGYQEGNADAASGWSIAVHESIDGWTTNIVMQDGPNFVYDLNSQSGNSVWVALDAQYHQGFATSADLKIVTAAELDSDPSLVCIGRVNVPMTGSISSANIIYNDTNYPRILPYANKNKDGFMSALQAEIVEILETPNASNAFENEYIITVSGPQIITIPNAETYVINGVDLKIFKNGIKLFKGRDYVEINRGDGFGERVQFTALLKINDRIQFNGQQYAVVLTNTLNLLDEGTQIQTNVTHLNFQGVGVTVLPDGNGGAKVVIPSLASVGTSKVKFNNSGAAIPAYRAITVISNGSISACNPTIPTHKPYGISSQYIPNGSSGYVWLDGVATFAVSGLGFSVGDDIFIDHSGNGTFTNVISGLDPLTGRIFRMGIADCGDAELSAIALDLVFDKQRIA